MKGGEKWNVTTDRGMEVGKYSTVEVLHNGNGRLIEVCTVAGIIELWELLGEELQYK